MVFDIPGDFLRLADGFDIPVVDEAGVGVQFIVGGAIFLFGGLDALGFEVGEVAGQQQQGDVKLVGFLEGVVERLPGLCQGAAGV